jgi:hypothetical protein
MLSFRQIGGAAWTLLGFMVAAAVVLSLRYRPLDEGRLLLDTWTGELRPVAVAPLDEATAARADPGVEDAVEIAVLQKIAESSAVRRTACTGVRFAFPAPERVEVRPQNARPRPDSR